MAPVDILDPGRGGVMAPDSGSMAHVSGILALESKSSYKIMSSNVVTMK